jgi:predicted PurR-regulated permease PerM
MNKIIYGAMSLFPVLAFAQGAGGTLSNLTGFVTQAKAIIDLLIPMAFALAIIYFFYGVAKYIGKAGDPKEAAAGKSIMIYGVIAIAVMASLYGIIAYLQNTVGVTTGNTITVPKLN